MAFGEESPVIAKAAFYRLLPAVMGLICIGLAGCATVMPHTSGIDQPPSVAQLKHMTPPESGPEPAKDDDGSLWRADSGLNGMFANAQARRVGDILTVDVVESASATNSAATKTDRGSSMAAGISNFFNLESKFPTTRTDFSPFGQVNGSLTSSFSGDGSTQRSGDLTTYISVRVVGLTPNGNLIIAGSRSVTINHEDGLIQISGIVRPEDVSSDNVVQSTRISDARIAYSGNGVVNDRQKPGWLTRVFDFVWPF